MLTPRPKGEEVDALTPKPKEQRVTLKMFVKLSVL